MELSKNDYQKMTIISWQQFSLFFAFIFFFPLIRKFWQVGDDYSLLLELADFVVLQNLIIMCTFVKKLIDY